LAIGVGGEKEGEEKREGGDGRVGTEGWRRIASSVLGG